MINKKYKIMYFFYILIMGIILFNSENLMEYTNVLNYVQCGAATGIPRPVPQMTTVAYTLLVVGTPLILIAFSIITLIKAIVSGNVDEVMKAKNKLFKKFLIAGIIFLTASIVQFIILRVVNTNNDKDSVSSCLKCFLYYSERNCPVSDTGNDINKNTQNKHHSNQAGSVKVPSSSNSNNSNSNIPSGSKTILVGDSRTVGICKLNSSGYYSGTCRDYLAVCEGGRGYNWFKSTGAPGVTKIIQSDSNTKYNIVILLGVNDIESTEYWANNAVTNYMNIIKEQANGDWKNHKIIFTSITPIAGEKTPGQWPVSKDNINYFNSQMKSKISSSGLSNVTYCDITTGLDLSGKIASDKLHYTSAGYDAVYNQLKNKCL